MIFLIFITRLVSFLKDMWYIHTKLNGTKPKGKENKRGKNGRKEKYKGRKREGLTHKKGFSTQEKISDIMYKLQVILINLQGSHAKL